MTQRIRLIQQHLVIQLVIYPSLDHRIDVPKIHDHPTMVQFTGLNRDLGHGVVPVQVRALALVIDQSMPVTELDLLRY